MKVIVNRLGRLARPAMVWLAVLGTLVLLGAALYLGDPIWWTLFCFAFVVVAYGMIYSRLSRRCIRVCIVEDAAVIQRGEPYAALAQVTWRFPMLWNGICLTYAAPNGEGVSPQECLIPPPKGLFGTVCQSVPLPVTTRYKGIYPIGLMNAKHRDLIGLFQAKIPIDYPERRVSLTVYPRAAEISDARLMLHLRQGASPSHNIFEAGLSGENRTYIMGDPLKMVNWKLTARMGELYVKQQEDDSSAGINLYIAAIPPAADSLELEQMAADQAASIAMQALSLHPRVAFYAYPSASPLSFGGTGQFDAVLDFLITTSLRVSDYAPDLEISTIRENLHQLNVAIVPAHASKEVFSLLLSMRKDSILFVNGTLPDALRAELEQTARAQGVALMVCAPRPASGRRKEEALC